MNRRLDKEVVLSVKNLTVKFFTKNRIVNAVNGISYDLYKGEILGIVGESGSGKSVNVLSITNLIRPPGKIINGEIIYNNTDILSLNTNDLRKIRGNEISNIFQDPLSSLNPVLKIGKQIIESILKHLKLNKINAKKRTINLINNVGIPSAEERYINYPHQFSGGMRQRIMISIGLSCDPKILIADEPTTALDVTIQAQIVNLIEKLKIQYNMSIIWITHDLGLLAGLADRIIVMYAGRIMEEANVTEIYENPKHPYTKALLESTPDLNDNSQDKLKNIDGYPPDMTKEIIGCPFYNRCFYKQNICFQTNPALRQLSTKHKIACHIDI
ncbi:MAG: peptide ABC transporter ATP-binding protein [Bacteroidetes bacterium]|nr:peptide ABC transporter ATP-binding protein [Bacteroidota bacterium]